MPLPSDWAALRGPRPLRRRRRLAFDVDNTALAPVLQELAGLGVENLTITPPSLEELFMRHYGDTFDTGDGNGAGAVEEVSSR